MELKKPVFQSNHEYESKIQKYQVLKKEEFKNEILEYELSWLELLNNVENPPKQKSLLMKKIFFKEEKKLEYFETLLQQVKAFKTKSRCFRLLKIREVYKTEQKQIILLQSNHIPLPTYLKTPDIMEIELLAILRSIIKIYFLMKQENIFETFVNCDLPLKPICLDSIFCFENKKTESYKYELDLLVFENKSKPDTLWTNNNFHLKNLFRFTKKLFRPFQNKKLSCSTKNFLRIIDSLEDKDIIWKYVLMSPLFKADCDVPMDLVFWKLEKSDRLPYTFSSSKIQRSLSDPDISSKDENKIENAPLNQVQDDMGKEISNYKPLNNHKFSEDGMKKSPKKGNRNFFSFGFPCSKKK